uniref:Uncharacterized protein n=1 Tax=Anguilla anguilla TaxID=7936 RepID=A0A0E9SCL3_ANGAN
MRKSSKAVTAITNRLRTMTVTISHGSALPSVMVSHITRLKSLVFS